MNPEEVERLIPDYLIKSELYSVIVTDLEGRFVFMNEKFLKGFSFIADNLIGQSAFLTIYHEDHEKCIKTIDELFKNPDKSILVKLRKPDTSINDLFWTEWEFSLLKDIRGNPLGVLCIGYDITRTERLSVQAKQLNHTINNIVEEITDGFFILNPNWEFIKVNKVAEEMLGFPREKLLGNKIWDVYDDLSNRTFPEAFRNAVKKHITARFEEYIPGTDKWYGYVCYPSKEGLTVFVRDITLTKKQQEKIKEQDKILRAIYNSNTEGNVFIDHNFIIRYINKRAYEVNKQIFHQDSKVGDNAFNYVAPELREQFLNLYQQALAGNNYTFERWYNNQCLEISILPVYDEQNQIIGISILFQDITDRKIKERKLILQNQALRQISWQQSHELRRPVARILGLCDLIQNHEKDNEELKPKLMEYVLEATRELDEIIRKIVANANENEFPT